MTTETPAGRELPELPACAVEAEMTWRGSLFATLKRDEMRDDIGLLYTADQMHAMYHQGREDERQAQEREGWVPVAMRLVLPRGSTTGWEDFDDAKRVETLRNNGWTVQIAYAAAPTGGSET